MYYKYVYIYIYVHTTTNNNNSNTNNNDDKYIYIYIERERDITSPPGPAEDPRDLLDHRRRLRGHLVRQGLKLCLYDCDVY